MFENIASKIKVLCRSKRVYGIRRVVQMVLSAWFVLYTTGNNSAPLSAPALVIFGVCILMKPFFSNVYVNIYNRLRMACN